MTTKKYLEQIERLELMIQNKEEEIRRWMNMGTSSTVPTDKEKIQTFRTSDLVGRSATEIVELSEQIKKLSRKRSEIISQIDSIENKMLYCVLTYRYVQLMSVHEVMDAIDRSEVQTRRLLKKAHEQFEKQYGHIYARKKKQNDMK